MVAPEILKEVSDPVDVAASVKVSDMLMAQWNNLRATTGLALPERPTDAEFDRMGLELVQTGHITAKLANGKEQKLSADDLKKTMLELAADLEAQKADGWEAVSKKLRDEAEELDRLVKDSEAMKKIKRTMAKAAEENTGPIFGLSFGNAIMGLLSYLGNVVSWLFSGCKGECPGFRESVTGYAAGNFKQSAHTALTKLGKEDPAVAAILSSKSDGKLVIDTLTEGMHRAVLVKGGVTVPPPPAKPRERKIDDVSGSLRNQVSGVNEYNARQIAAVALATANGKSLEDALKFEVGGRKVDLNYSPVQAAVGFVRDKLGKTPVTDDQAKLLQEEAGKRVAVILGEKADEYAKLTPEKRAEFVARELNEAFTALQKEHAVLKDMPATTLESLSGVIAAGITDPANEKHFRILPKAAVISVQVPPQKDLKAGAPLPTLESVFHDMAEEVKKKNVDIKGFLAKLDPAKAEDAAILEKLKDAQKVFTEAAATVVKRDVKLLEDPKKLADEIRAETLKELEQKDYYKTMSDKDKGSAKALLFAMGVQIKAQLKDPKWREYITQVAAGGAQPTSTTVDPSLLPTSAPPKPIELTPEEKTEQFEQALRDKLKEKLDEQFDVNTAQGRFMTDVYTRRTGKAPDTEQMAATVAKAIAPSFIEGGEFVRKDGDNYVHNDTAAFLSGNHIIHEALRTVMPDNPGQDVGTLRVALSNAFIGGLLEEKRPGFALAAIPAEHTSAAKILLEQEVHAMLEDGFNPAKNPKIDAMIKGIEKWNGQPVDYERVKKVSKDVIVRMLSDKATREKPDGDFLQQLNTEIQAELVKTDSNNKNLAGYQHAEIIASFTPAFAALVTKKVKGPDAKVDLVAHEVTFMGAMISGRMQKKLNDPQNAKIMALEGTEAFRDPKQMEVMGKAMADAIEYMRQRPQEMDAGIKASGERWGYDHAMNVMTLKLEASGIKLNPLARKVMVQAVLEEVRSEIPRSESWKPEYFKEGMTELAQVEIAKMLAKSTSGSVLASRNGGIVHVASKLAPLVTDDAFMKLDTIEKQKRIATALGGGTENTLLAYGLACEIDGKDAKSVTNAAAGLYNAPNPLLLGVSPKDALSIGGALTGLGVSEKPGVMSGLSHGISGQLNKVVDRLKK